ncbi:MAG: hypothetical protein UF030_07635 [Eggerthellaceae bacterium]|nr:hypothetical protein [Eggerthellaceae bacterium]
MAVWSVISFMVLPVLGSQTTMRVAFSNSIPANISAASAESSAALARLSAASVAEDSASLTESSLRVKLTEHPESKKVAARRGVMSKAANVCFFAIMTSPFW